MEPNYDELLPDLTYYICRHSTPTWEIEESVIAFTDLSYIIEGEARYVVDGRVVTARQGDLLCIPPGSRRRATTSADNLMTSHAANLDLRDGTGNPLRLPFPVISSIGLRDDLLDMYQELNMTWTHRRMGYRLKSRAIIMNILHYVLELLHYRNSYEMMDPRVQKVVRHVLSHWSEPFVVGEIAESLSLHPVYFGSLFKQNMGMGLKEYVNRTRVNHAENLLASGEYSVQETARKCGFDDIFYFSRMYRRYKGYNASEAKRHVRRKAGEQ